MAQWSVAHFPAASLSDTSVGSLRQEDQQFSGTSTSTIIGCEAEGLDVQHATEVHVLKLHEGLVAHSEGLVACQEAHTFWIVQKCGFPKKRFSNSVDSVDSFYWKNIHKNRQLWWWFAYGQPQVSFYIQCSTSPSMFNKLQQKLRPLSQCWQVLNQRTLAWQNWQSQLR